jgi:hypothetical protein
MRQHRGGGAGAVAVGDRRDDVLVFREGVVIGRRADGFAPEPDDGPPNPREDVARADAPFDSTEEYVDHGLENPGELTFASAGIGSLNHIVPEWINSVAGIDTLHIPYPGGAPAATAIASGEADVGVLALSSVGPFVDSGDIKTLGLARAERVESHPDIPTLAEGSVEEVAAGTMGRPLRPRGHARRDRGEDPPRRDGLPALGRSGFRLHRARRPGYAD